MSKVPTAKDIKFHKYRIKRGFVTEQLRRHGLRNIDAAIAKIQGSPTIPFFASLGGHT